MIPYPKDLPLNEIQAIVDMVRNNRVTSSRVAFAKDVWIVIGYILNESVGDQSTALQSLMPISDETAVATLVHLHAMGKLPGSGIVWKQLLKWALQLVASQL